MPLEEQTTQGAVWGKRSFMIEVKPHVLKTKEV